MLASELTQSEYHSYYKSYIELAGNAELMANLEQGQNAFISFLKTIPNAKLTYCYAPKKWTLAEVVQHIIDAERVFQYRAFRFSRNDATSLPGFDHDAYVTESKANSRKLSSIVEEYNAVRNSTLALFRSFGREELLRVGTASNAQLSVRALGFVICGHQEHHRKIIEARYLK